MKKRKKKAIRQEREREKKEKLRRLDEYNSKNYFADLEYLGRLNFLSESTRSWIETTMYELRGKANKYEQKLADYLIGKKIKFIHQAPFVFQPKRIYFVDFYLPDARLVVEVDGIYHQGNIQFEKDRERDGNFRSIGIRVMRIHNEEISDNKKLGLRFSEYL